MNDVEYEFEQRVATLMRCGLTPGEALAYWAVEIRGYSQTKWAEECGYSGHSAVGQMVRSARRKLADD